MARLPNTPARREAGRRCEWLVWCATHVLICHLTPGVKPTPLVAFGLDDELCRQPRNHADDHAHHATRGQRLRCSQPPAPPASARVHCMRGRERRRAGARRGDCWAACGERSAGRVDSGSDALLHRWCKERPEHALPGGVARGSSAGIPAPGDVHAARGGRCKPARSWLALHWTGGRRAVELPEPPESRHAPIAGKAAVGIGSGITPELSRAGTASA